MVTEGDGVDGDDDGDDEKGREGTRVRGRSRVATLVTAFL